MQLSDSEIHKIVNVGKPVFLGIEAITGVPWQAIACIWYRENSLSTLAPHTPGGVFQFDPLPDLHEFQHLAAHFTKLSPAQFMMYWKRGVNDFQSGALLCALWLQRKAKRPLTPHSADEEIRDAFWGYNGHKQPTVDESPYVMNGLDAAHMNMIIKGSIPDGKGGRTHIEHVDPRPGAYTIYRQLRKLA